MCAEKSVPARYGRMIILSGPSGSGKSTLSKRALEEFDSLRFSVSCTTRSPRGAEVDGVDYHFLTKEVFEKKIAEDAFLEYACVHGNYYGTLLNEVIRHLEAGTDVLLDIDVQGAMKILEKCKKDPILAGSVATIFIAPPSYTELERRLRGRGTDAEETILKRLANAKGEMAQWRKYDYLLLNDDVEEASIAFLSLVRSLRMDTKCLRKEPFDE